MTQQTDNNDFLDNYNNMYSLEETSNIDLHIDGTTLVQKTNKYFSEKFKKIQYTDFNDKNFVNKMKNLIKNKKKFTIYLNTIQFDIDDFLHIGVYVFPNCFSTSIIKYLKLEYLDKNK